MSCFLAAVLLLDGFILLFHSQIFGAIDASVARQFVANVARGQKRSLGIEFLRDGIRDRGAKEAFIDNEIRGPSLGTEAPALGISAAGVAEAREDGANGGDEGDVEGSGDSLGSEDVDSSSAVKAGGGEVGSIGTEHGDSVTTETRALNIGVSGDPASIGGGKGAHVDESRGPQGSRGELDIGARDAVGAGHVVVQGNVSIDWVDSAPSDPVTSFRCMDDEDALLQAAGVARPGKAPHNGSDLVHVAYAPDKKQASAVKASIASVATAAAAPERLVVHLLVESSTIADFREYFGLRAGCKQLLLTTGTRVKMHKVDAELVKRSMATVPESVQKVRGRLDSPLNFMRFYLHEVLREHVVGSSPVVVYLDTDVILQGDVAELAAALAASGKTAAFARRPSVRTVPPARLLGKPPLQKPECAARAKRWPKLLEGHTYNVGVFAMNLKRWEEKQLTLRVEGLVKDHNNCDGKLWVGGSQPPMLLALLEDGNEGHDFIELDATWNLGDLGWKTDIKKQKLASARVLHWTGPKKPWKDDGLYTHLWRPHLKRWGDLLPPAVGPLACQLMVAHDGKLCRVGDTWSCAAKGDSVIVRAGCHGLFLVAGVPTFCIDQQTGAQGPSLRTVQHSAEAPGDCKRGFLPSPEPRATCGIMLISTFFVGIKDWQKKRSQSVTFAKIGTFYYTTLAHGLNVTMVHDGLPASLMEQWRSARFQFVQVDVHQFKNDRIGVNDLRYHFFAEIIKKHPEWQYVFVLDSFDVRVAMNPCTSLQDGKLYVGSETTSLKRNRWLRTRFDDMGGKYLQWYKGQDDPKRMTLNCGITGGRRDLMLRLAARMEEVCGDEHLQARTRGVEVNVNMAALNYVVYREYAGMLVTGAPVHSKYWKEQTNRTDVWFIHK